MSRRADSRRGSTYLMAGMILLCFLLSGALAVWVAHLGDGHHPALPGVALLSLTGAFFYYVAVLAPLTRMARAITAMRRSGKAGRLPVLSRGELGVVAAGFNQLAEQIEEQQRRLREQITELQRVNAEYDEFADLRDEFLVTINHQLRTPLTSVMEGIELIRDGALGPISEDQRTLLRSIDENAVRLAHLIEEALDISLLKSGRRPLRRQPNDLAAVLRQSLTGAAAETPPHIIRLRCGELPPVYMDAAAIQEVMDHLLRNALRHAPAHTEVEIATAVRDGLVTVSVRDQGPGMSAAQLERLFQPFVHVHTPDAPGSQGSGLGLAFCRQVIERHRGEIHARSDEGQGMTMTFALPIASSHFLFEEACRSVQEDAEYERGQFGLVLAAPLDPERAAGEARATIPATRGVLDRAEAILRTHTHRGDQFVRLEDGTLVVLAVTDGAGLEAMVRRLRGVLERAQVGVCLATALFPLEGDAPARLLETARRRIAEAQQQPDHATIGRPASAEGV